MRAMTPSSGNVYGYEPCDAADAGPYEQHGHKEARRNGAARCPDCPSKVEDEHDYERCVAKFPVRAS